MDKDLLRNIENVSDETGLLELFRKVWINRLLFVVLVLGFLAAGVIYLFVATEIYESKIAFSIGPVDQVESYNLGRLEAGFEKLTTEKIQKVFLQTLRSADLRRAFIEKEYLPSLGGSEANAWASFSNALNFSQVDSRGGGNLYVLSMRTPNAALSKELVDKYLDMATSIAKSEIRARIEAERKVRADSLRYYLRVLRDRGRAEREDLIQQVEDALKIARAANLEMPAEGMVVSVRSSDTSLLYLRGVKALTQQLSLLRSRKNDDPFIQGLREVSTQLSLLDGMKTDDADLRLVKVEVGSVIASSPIAPRKFLVIVVSLTMGVVAGVIASVIRRPTISK